jgi:hypothetical protein
MSVIFDLAGWILMKNTLAYHSLWALSDTREKPKMLMLNLDSIQYPYQSFKMVILDLAGKILMEKQSSLSLAFSIIRYKIEA